MKWLILALAVMACSVAKAQNLPRIGTLDSQHVWIQTVQSEIDQRIELKQLQQKLDDYVKKTGEIEALQALINEKTAKKDSLSKQGAEKYEAAISELSGQISDCNSEVVKFRADNTALRKSINKVTRGRNTWRGIGIGGAALALLAIFL